jgi:endoglycosylceramidase
MRALPALVLVLAACTPGAETPPEDAPIRLRADADGLFGPDGRQLLLRGVNARVEGLFDVTFDDGRVALEPIPPFTAEDCTSLAGLGFNLLRLPVNWSGLEPARGAYEAAYVDGVREVVSVCWDAGVYTLVDLHQDAYSKHIGEDGAPLWAIVPPPDELLEGPLEDLAERRTSGQVLRSFRSFFDDEEDLQGAYGAMAAHLAAGLADLPGLVGIELMNEPLAFDDEALDAFHDTVGAAVREAVGDLPLVFEPDSLRNFNDSDPATFPWSLGNGVYAPHHYTDVFTDGWAGGDVNALRASVQAAAAEAAIHRSPLLVGEFGNSLGNPNGRLWFEESLTAYDEVGASWAFWVWEEWSQDSWGLWDAVDGEEGPGRGAFREEMADLLARPFPQAIDGTLEGFVWDGEALTVSLSNAGDGTHTLAAPLRAWPGDVDATCDGAPAEAARDEIGGRLEVACRGSELRVAPR